jgi:hypothetical protein
VRKRGERKRAELKLAAAQGFLLLLLLAAVFPGTFFQGEVICPGDILFQSLPWSLYAPEGWERPQNRLMSDVVTAFYPYYAVSLDAWRDGEWALWNPYEMTGIPLHANAQSTTLYPPRLLHAWFGLRWGTTLYILLKLWLCGMSAWLCARLMRLSAWGAAFLGVAWMLASYNLIWANWSLPDVSVWVPLVFAGSELTLRRRYWQGGLLLAFGGCMILLAGHPETAFAMSMGVGLYFLVRLLFNRARGGPVAKPMAACALAWGLALVMAAAQLLPFIEYLLHSSTFFDRPHEYRVTWLSMQSLTGLFVPRFFGTSADLNFWGDINSNLVSMFYPGMIVWAGVALAVPMALRNRLFRARAVALCTAAVLGLMLAYRAPVVDAVHRLPLFSSMLYVYNAVFACFAMPMIAALAFDAWIRRGQARHLLWTLVPAALAALLAWFFYGAHGRYLEKSGLAEYAQTQIWIALLLAGCAGLVLAVPAVFKRRRLALALGAVLLCADLLYANRGLNPTMPAEQVFPRTQLTDYLKELPQPTRIGAGEGNIASGLLAVYGIEEWLGYDGLYPARIMRFLRAMQDNIWNAMAPATGIEYFLHDPRFEPLFPLDSPHFERIASINGLEVHRYTKSLGRAWLTPEVEVVTDFDIMLAIMEDPAFDPSRTALLERPLAHAPPGAAGLRGEVEVESRTTTRALARGESDRESVLVFADAYYPGWKAFVNGQPSEMFPVYSIFRGVVVPAGEWEVEYVYRPLSFFGGLGLSAAGWLAFLGIAAWRTMKQSAKRGHAAPAESYRS